ncbi:FxsA family protein [Desulfovibrio subterraneus]|uniref:FxsA family protein n=1 Tax=Desulfovibrio subterraneus TaxID=2718620 RepID=UPI0022B86B2E|nr:FxsA family protein [Desulfovibrio subterraneus]WBF67515.1 FxsA family protein [Desulfovibrio subterraneus]
MFSKLFLLFTLIPIMELYTLVEVGSVIGVGSTILIVILTGVIGAWLARMEGFNTMLKVRESLAQGKVPADEMVEGLLILVAGLLLLTPGFITDCMGIVLLAPFTRKPFARMLRKQFNESVKVQGAGSFGSANSAGFTYYTWHSSGGRKAPGDGPLSVQDLEARLRGETSQEPRKAVVIDCDPIEDKENGSR